MTGVQLDLHIVKADSIEQIVARQLDRKRDRPQSLGLNNIDLTIETCCCIHL